MSTPTPPPGPSAQPPPGPAATAAPVAAADAARATPAGETPPPSGSARRGDRGRRVVRSSSRVLILLAVVFGALLAWLLLSVGGRDTLLARIVDRLPPGALTWERAEGVVRGPLVLHGVRYRDGGVEFTARRVLLDPDLLPILGRRLQLDRLEVHGAMLTLPAADAEPFALPRWPESLPRIDLPLDLRATTLRIRDFDVRRGEAPLLSIARGDARALWLVDAGIVVDALALHGDFGRATLRGTYRPDRDVESDLTATWQRPARDGSPAVSLLLRAAGDLDALRVEIAGAAPGRVAATLALHGSRDAPDWTLALQSDGLDPTLLGAPPGSPWRASLDARGRGGDATLAGDAVVDGLRIAIAESRVSLADAGLTADPLRLEFPAGAVDVVGSLSVVDGRPVFDATVRSDGLAWAPSQGEAGAAPVRARGQAVFAGHVDAWTVTGAATLTRGDDAVALDVAGRGDRDALVLRRLVVRLPDGRDTLAGAGRVQWSPVPAFALDARLAGFDPGHFLPDYPGRVDGTLVARAERRDGGWHGDALLDSLAGDLRGRALGGHVHLDWRGDRGAVDANVALGSSRVQVAGAVGAVLDVRATFAPLQLADAVAGSEGRIDGTLALRGPARAADVDGDLRATDVRWNDLAAGSLAIRGRLPARGADGALRIDATDATLAGVAFAQLGIDATGSQADLRVQADGRGGAGDAVLAGAFARDAHAWRGRIDTLRLAPTTGPRLALEAPFAFRFADGHATFERACVIAVEDGGRVCAVGDARSLSVDADAVPLALLQPWLPVDEAVPMQAFGLVDADLRLRRGAGGWVGDGTLRSAHGGLRLLDDLDHEVFAYRDLQLTLDVGANVVDARLDAALADGGRITAQLRGGEGDAAPVSGTFALDIRDLAWLELFSEDLAAPVGHLTGTLALSGTRGAPRFSGRAAMSGFAAELPGLGVKLRDGAFDLVGAADGQVRVDGRVTSGDGVLRLDGSLDFRDDSAPVRLRLRGERVTLASTAELYLVAAPDLELRWLADVLQVRGELAVDEARLDLESLDGSAEVSRDVVVVDAESAPGTRERPLDLELAVTLRDDVRLTGFGLDGTMRGALTLRQRPGRSATGQGALEVDGTYRAYGQSLVIERARLGYAAGTPFDDPTLDIRAQREFDTATVGVRVRGTARRPETTIVSNPPMDTSEALSWLVLGRPLSTTTGGESRQLGAAALALGAGGNLVAQQIGVKLGLDEAGVVDSRNLGGATFTVGKYVSPRLFLSYGVSLIGTGQVVTLKYLLTRGFDISVESGNENAASLNWRIEK